MKDCSVARMTDDEVRAFLAKAVKAEVATIRRDGTPHIVPMAYTLLDGDVAFWAYVRSQKVANLRRDPRIACLVESGERRDELRGVLLVGRADIISDPELGQRLSGALMERYPGVLTDTYRAAIAASAAKRVAIVVKADRVISWDYRKLRDV